MMQEIEDEQEETMEPEQQLTKCFIQAPNTSEQCTNKE
jgi:hypothetical protein